MDIHIYHHVIQEADSPTKTALAEIITRLTALQKQGATMQADLDKIEAAVAEETTVIGGVVTLLDQLHTELQNAGDDPVKVQAVLDHISSNKSALAAAVAANTPAAV